tara:strand:+ start:35778 stop:36482 length:705 start_codon:yes stop_codon:yes gene_type:complete
MRKDMDKVLVTTPRVGSSMKNGEVKESRRQEREGDYDNLPHYSSMKPKSLNWDDRKSLNEYLNPLVRYLAKNCNRPWDKVYSEICENMDRRGAVQNHIFEHLFDYVELHPVIKNGKPHRTGYRGLSRLYKSGWTFYVDKNGLLKEPRERPPPWRGQKSNPNLIKTKDTSVFIIRREDDGTWFKASLEDWPDHNFAFVCKNPDWVISLLGTENIRSRKVVLKTLSKREKKEHSLV